MKKSLFLLSLFFATAFNPVASAQSEGPSLSRVLKATLDGSRSDPLVYRLYQTRNFEPLWSEAGRPKRDAEKLLQAIRRADEHGLKSADYTANDTIGDLKNDSSLVDFDLALTKAFVSLAKDLKMGRIPYKARTFYWRADPTRTGKAGCFGLESGGNPDSPPNPHRGNISAECGDVTEILVVLEKAIVSGDFDGALASLVKNKPGYTRLQQALKDYRERAAKGEDWGHVPAGPKLEVGIKDARVASLRERLRKTGELKRPSKNPPQNPEAESEFGLEFDGELAQAVRLFQGGHGLEPDGKVGAETLTALNTSIDERVRQIVANLERRRWVLEDLGQRHVFVNVPEFHLYAVEDGQAQIKMNVVVGQRKDWNTPLLSSSITHLVLNPQWHVPKNIIKKEILAKIQEDPEYLTKERMTAYRVSETGSEEIDPATFDWKEASAEELKIIQKEGDGAALGRIKFMFSNPFDIYLHDTPQQKFFSYSMRALSHGCVRVEKPMDLAEFVTKGSAWGRDKIAVEIKKGKNQWIPLSTPVPLHILYWTVWVDKDGTTHFLNDLYGQDKAVAKLLGL